MVVPSGCAEVVAAAGESDVVPIVCSLLFRAFDAAAHNMPGAETLGNEQNTS
jgi:hypothetical protein